MEFHPFGTAVHKRFVQMAKGDLFTVGAPDDDVFAAYLAAFPPGTNPIYKTRTEHDCSCCKQFIRNIGRVVSLDGGKVHTVWSGIAPDLEYPYDQVAAAMDEHVRGLPLQSIFRSKERQYGNESTRQMIDGHVHVWHHFYGVVTGKHYTANPEAERGTFNTTVQVFKRGLEELTPDAVQQVIDLISDNMLYRGEEHLSAVTGFRKRQREYLKLPAAERDVFVFLHATDPATRFRNTVIGTLVQDLSNGVDLDTAVKAFETKVAPTNYKRTTALITPRMVADAMQTITKLGLEPCLERRLATIADVSVNNVLWVDRSVRGKMKDAGVKELLMAHAKPATPSSDPITDIDINKFMDAVLPTAIGMDIHVRNVHQRNFVTLTAPVHGKDMAFRGNLFKWDNDFAWSYDGNVTDSIREKVKRAGGNVDAKLRFSLAWYNYDDLDFHVRLPNGSHIYFGQPHDTSGYDRGQRILDVDMNAGYGTTREPVENLSFTNPKDGKYSVWVNQFNRRETTDVGFAIEVADSHGTSQFSYEKGIPNKADVPVGVFLVRDGRVVDAEIAKGLQGKGISVDKWGVKTESMVRVQTVMYSPNFWDNNAVGNKHWFFMLEGCKTDAPQRGIYNEFLASGLEAHRKVFEVLGDKTKCPVTDEQLSGLGFSSTRGDTVTISVKTDRGARLFNVHF